MPRDLLQNFLTQYLTTDTPFHQLLKENITAVKEIGFNPSQLSESEQAQLSEKLHTELSAIDGPFDQPSRWMLQLYMQLSPKSKHETFIRAQIPESIQRLRQNRKLVSYIKDVVHSAEDDISDLYWAYLSGSKEECTAIQEMLQILPLEFPFIKFLRQMLGLVEHGLAPELFPTLMFRIFQESDDGSNPFETDEELQNPNHIELLKGFTKGTVTQLRRRLTRILRHDHDNRHLLALLKAYPSDGTIAPYPILEHLSGTHINYRPSSVLSGDFANQALCRSITAQEAQTGSLLISKAKCLTPEVLSALGTLSAQPIDENLAFVIARCLPNTAAITPEELLQNAVLNPALYSTVLCQLDSLSTPLKDELRGAIKTIGRQGYAAIKMALDWLHTEQNISDTNALIDAALSSASSFCPHVCTLLTTHKPEAVQNKAMHTLQLTLWNKQRHIHGCIDHVDLNSLSIDNVIVCAEIAASHFSRTLRKSFESAFRSYMKRNSPQPEIVYWLSHSKDADFQVALQQWVQDELSAPAKTKWDTYHQYLLKYSTTLVSSFSDYSAALNHPSPAIGIQYLDNAKTQTNFELFALIRFSFVFTDEDFREEWNRLIRSSVNKYNNPTFSQVAKRNPKLFKDNYEWHVRNEWKRSNDKNGSLTGDYTRIIPKQDHHVQLAFERCRFTNFSYYRRRDIENKSAVLVDQQLEKDFKKEDNRSDKDFNQWREERVQERHGMTYWSWRNQLIAQANTEASLAVLKETMSSCAHKSQNTFIQYRQHLNTAWNNDQYWTDWDKSLSMLIIKKTKKHHFNRWGRTPFLFSEILEPYDQQNPPEKKTIDLKKLWPWLNVQLQYKNTDNIASCLKFLLESHDSNGVLKVNKSTIEEYMRRIFIHRISLVKLQHRIKDGVLQNLAKHHKKFFLSWLAYLLRTGTSTLVVGRFLMAIPLEEVIQHRTIRRTAVMVRSIFDKVVRFLEDDDSPRSDRIFNLIMEVALDESEPKTTLAVALVNLGFSKRLQTWIANHPARVEAFMNKHADWIETPAWDDPFFPIYIALWQNQSMPHRQDIILFLRKGYQAARYAEGLMHCVVSHHPQYFSYMLTMITNPHPTPSEVIHRDVIRASLIGLGRIRTPLSREDRMLILTKLDAHYRREILPLVRLLTDEEWTLELTLSILEAISMGGMRKHWEFIFEHRHDFSHWLRASEEFTVWNWWVRRPLQQKLGLFPLSDYKKVLSTAPDRIWALFNKCSKTEILTKYLSKLFKTTEDIDTLSKINTFIKYGLSKKVRVHWALQFSALEDSDSIFNYLSVLNDETLRKEVLKHHFHLFVPVIENHTERFLNHLSNSSQRLDIIKKMEESNFSLSRYIAKYPFEILHLYSPGEDYKAFSYITSLQGISDLSTLETTFQKALAEAHTINTELIGRWYANNSALITSTAFLSYVFKRNLISTYETDILALPVLILNNQPAVWSYLSKGTYAPYKPDKNRYSHNISWYERQLKQYTDSFFYRLLTRVVTDLESKTLLIEQTFWNGETYYLNHRGGLDLLKENNEVLLNLANRNRSRFALRYLEVFSEPRGFYQEDIFLAMLLPDMLRHTNYAKLLSILANHVRSLSNKKGKHHCLLLDELNKISIRDTDLLQGLVRELIKEPGTYRLIFNQKFFTACLQSLITKHPRSMGAYLRRLPYLLETSNALQDIGPAILDALPLYELKKSIHETTSLFFYRGSNPWRSVLLQRIKKEPILKAHILEYALNSLAQRTAAPFSCIEMDLTDLRNPVIRRSHELAFKELPENKRKHNHTFDSWTDDNQNTSHARAQFSNFYSAINAFENTRNMVQFYAWSGSFNNVKGRLHVFKDDNPLMVHSVHGDFMTSDGTKSSSSIQIQTHYQDRQLRFYFAPLTTNNVFEKLRKGYCAYQYQAYNENREPDSPVSWGSWRPNHNYWIYSTHHPLLHPHAQSLVEALSPLHGGYAYPNLDLSPEYELIEAHWEDTLLDNLSTKTLMSLLFCPSTMIQREAKKQLKLRTFKPKDILHLFELPEHEWLWGHVTTRPMATLEKVWGNVLAGMVWEDPKRQKQIRWFLNRIYTPERAESLVQEVESAILQGRGWVTSPGIVHHRDFLWEAINNMDLGLRIRGLIAMAEGPLYQSAIPELKRFRDTVIGSLHILAQNILPDSGVWFPGKTIFQEFNTELESQIEERVNQITEEDLLKVEDWQSLALHQKVGHFIIKLTDKISSLDPQKTQTYAAYLMSKVDESSVSLFLEHMNVILHRFSSVEQETLLSIWLDGMRHPSLARVRTFCTTQVHRLLQSNTDTHPEIYAKLLRALSRRPKYDGMSQDIYAFVSVKLAHTHGTISKRWIWTLVNGSQAYGHRFALEWLQNPGFFEPDTLSIDQLVKLAIHTDAEIRNWSLTLLHTREISPHELIALMPLLETGPFDVQNIIADRLRSEADLPLSLLLRLVDSTKSAQSPTALSITELGQELLEKHYGVDLNQDLVLQLSEHPSDEAEDYVAAKLAEDQSAERMKALTPYFKRVLTRLNSGRPTREAILAYLRSQALSGQDRAESIVSLLEWMCNIHVVADQLYSLETLALVQERYPNLETSIEL